MREAGRLHSPTPREDHTGLPACHRAARAPPRVAQRRDLVAACVALTADVFSAWKLASATS
jgi:hypothetical protein